MVTKKFIVSERVNNEWKNITTWNDKANALRAVATSLMNDETANPQDFKVEEVEEINEKGTLMEAANAIDEKLKIFGVTFKITDLCSDDGGFLVMSQLCEYPSLSSVEMRCIIEELDGFNVTLPEGCEVFFTITHECAIRLFLSRNNIK